LQNSPNRLGLRLDISDNCAKYMPQKCFPHTPAMVVGSSNKFEISGLAFQMHFPPLSWLGKTDYWRYASHCPLCFAILCKVWLGFQKKNFVTHNNMMSREAVCFPKCLEEFPKFWMYKILPSLFLPYYRIFATVNYNDHLPMPTKQQKNCVCSWKSWNRYLEGPETSRVFRPIRAVPQVPKVIHDLRPSCPGRGWHNFIF
jgi:hypothetical protein